MHVTFTDLWDTLQRNIVQRAYSSRIELKKTSSTDFSSSIDVMVDEAIYAKLNFYDTMARTKRLEPGYGKAVRGTGAISIYNYPNSSILESFPLFHVDIQSDGIRPSKTFGASSLQELADILFPVSQAADMNCIIRLAKSYLNYDVNNNDIQFDFKTRTYSFKESLVAEHRDLETAFKTDGIQQVCKYTSLGTFFKLLENKKIRMNSLVSMNDKQESYFIDKYLYKEVEQERIIVTSDNYLICSFTNLIDDLLMWRLYGDDAKGICMIFSYDGNPKNMEFRKILYQSDKSEFKSIEKYKQFIDALIAEKISFKFKSIESLKYFFKSKEYCYENEFRLLSKETDVDYYLN